MPVLIALAEHRLRTACLHERQVCTIRDHDSTDTRTGPPQFPSPSNDSAA